MKTLSQIQSDVVRLGSIDSSDTTSINSIVVDCNDALGIVASQKNWDELFQTGTISLSLADGDKNYALNSNVDKIEKNNLRITSPLNYARMLFYTPRKEILLSIPAKSNNGTGTPSRWYWEVPTISVNNVETKNISFDIMPNQNYTVTYYYKAYPPQMVNVADQPFFDQNYHQILVDYCLFKYAERNPDVTLNPDSFEGKWLIGLNELLASYDSKLTENNPIQGPNIYTGRYNITGG